MARARNRISKRLISRITADFGDASATSVLDALGALELPFDGGEVSERILGAIVLQSGGDLAQFDEAVGLAKADWRDLLVAADLANEDWPMKLDQRLGPGRRPSIWSRRRTT